MLQSSKSSSNSGSAVTGVASTQDGIGGPFVPHAPDAAILPPSVLEHVIPVPPLAVVPPLADAEVPPEDDALPPEAAVVPPGELPPVELDVPPESAEDPPVALDVPPDGAGAPPVELELPPEDAATPPVELELPPEDAATPPVGLDPPVFVRVAPPDESDFPPEEEGEPPDIVPVPPANVLAPPEDADIPPDDATLPPEDADIPPDDEEWPPVDALAPPAPPAFDCAGSTVMLQATAAMVAHSVSDKSVELSGIAIGNRITSRADLQSANTSGQDHRVQAWHSSLQREPRRHDGRVMTENRRNPREPYSSCQPRMSGSAHPLDSRALAQVSSR